MTAVEITSAGLLSAADETPTVDLVVPVYNEEVALEDSVLRLLGYLDTMPFSYRVTIADNASTDGTALIAQRLAHQHRRVSVVHLELKGRGRALKRVWSASRSPVVAYMDVDLSTDLNALLPLVAPLLTGHSDIAIGSRLSRGSLVQRGAKREVISRGYNLLLRGTLRARFSDAQCGFKALRREAADQLLPWVQDDGWFFDTELLVLAERAHLRIHEVPVDWVDDPDSRVDILRTAADDVRGIVRLGRTLVRGEVPVAELRRQLGRTRQAGVGGRLGAQATVFALIGVLSTVAYAALFLLFRTAMGPQSANALALMLTTLANTAANRRLTFGVQGTTSVVRHHAQGLFVLALGLVATSAALEVGGRALGTTHPGAEIAVLTVVNLGVTVGRFVAMRCWIFRRRAAA